MHLYVSKCYLCAIVYNERHWNCNSAHWSSITTHYSLSQHLISPSGQLSSYWPDTMLFNFGYHTRRGVSTYARWRLLWQNNQSSFGCIDFMNGLDFKGCTWLYNRNQHFRCLYFECIADHFTKEIYWKWRKIWWSEASNFTQNGKSAIINLLLKNWDEKAVDTYLCNKLH